MDIIGLESIDCLANIGLLDWERQIRQKVSIDLELRCDMASQIAKEDLSNGVDYALVHALVKETVESGSWLLIEAMAEQLCQLLLSQFPIASIKIKVAKLGILRGVKRVWVQLERDREWLGMVISQGK